MWVEAGGLVGVQRRFKEGGGLVSARQVWVCEGAELALRLAIPWRGAVTGVDRRVKTSMKYTRVTLR